MRVTHVITRLIVGGAQENTVSTVLGLDKISGVRVDLISGPSSGAEGSLASNFESRPGLLRELPHLTRPVRPWQDLLALRDLKADFQRHRPDIVHTHSGKAGVLGRFAAHSAGVPLIIHTIHGPSFGTFQGFWPNLLFRKAELRAARHTTHFISVAQAMTDQYLAAGIGQPGQYSRIFSGFPLDPFLRVGPSSAYRNRWGLTRDDFVVGKIARLFDLKGHDDLLQMTAKLRPSLPNLKVLLIGDGPLNDSLTARAAELGIADCVIFAGLVRPDEVPDCLGAMDVVIHLSRREGLPRALSQALAAARPVVAYDCDGSREVCLEGQTGRLIRPGDIGGASKALLELGGSPEQRRAFGQRGRDFVRAEFSEERMVSQIFELYQSLTASRNGAGRN